MPDPTPDAGTGAGATARGRAIRLDGEFATRNRPTQWIGRPGMLYPFPASRPYAAKH